MNYKAIILFILSLIPGYFGWVFFFEEEYAMSFLLSAISYFIIYLGNLQANSE